MTHLTRLCLTALLLVAALLTPAPAHAGTQLLGLDGQEAWTTQYVDAADLTAIAERDQVVLRWTGTAGTDSSWCHATTPRTLQGIYPDGLMYRRAVMTPGCPGRPDLLVDYVATVTADTWAAGQSGDGVESLDTAAPLAAITATPRYPTGGPCVIRKATAGPGKWVTLKTVFPDGSVYSERQYQVPLRVRTTPGCWGGAGKYRYARFRIVEEAPTTHFADARTTARRTVTMLVRLPVRQDLTVQPDVGSTSVTVPVPNARSADR